MGLVLFVIIRWRVTSEKSYKAVVLSGGQGGPLVRPEGTTFPTKIIW